MTMAWILLSGSVALAIGVSFLCSLLESALLSLTPSQLAEIRESSARRGVLCSKLKKDVETSLAVILICNTAAHTIGAAVAGAQFSVLFGQGWLGLFTLAFTVVMVQYTEILPKTLGVAYNRQIMAASASALFAAGVILRPVIRLSHWINRPFEVRQAEQPSTAREIAALAKMAERSQEISSRQEHIIAAAPRLSELTAAEVMLPRELISFIASDQSPTDAINAVHTDFHTRYPVCENGNPDRVLGYLNFKELVAGYRANPERVKLADLVRPIGFAEPSETAARLLERFAVEHWHLAIVRGSRGETLGLVTLEDIVEELIGDLDDEFDPLPRTFYSPNEGMWVIGGGVPMAVIAMETPLMLPKTPATASEWFCRRSRSKVRVGAVQRFRNAEFTVRKIRRGRVLEFRVKRIAI